MLAEMAGPSVKIRSEAHLGTPEDLSRAFRSWGAVAEDCRKAAGVVAKTGFSLPHVPRRASPPFGARAGGLAGHGPTLGRQGVGPGARRRRAPRRALANCGTVALAAAADRPVVDMMGAFGSAWPGYTNRYRYTAGRFKIPKGRGVVFVGYRFRLVLPMEGDQG